MQSSPTHAHPLKTNDEDGVSEDFALILGHCLADLVAGRATIEDCLQRYPAQAGRLAVILPFAERTQVVSASEDGPTAAHPASSLVL